MNGTESKLETESNYFPFFLLLAKASKAQASHRVENGKEPIKRTS